MRPAKSISKRNIARIIVTMMITGMIQNLLSAGPSASHSIRIRIVRTNYISIQNFPLEQDEFQASETSDCGFKLRWKASNKSKKISISSKGNHTNGPIIIGGIQQIELSSTDQTIFNSIENLKGDCTLEYKGSEDTNEPVSVTLTMTDA